MKQNEIMTFSNYQTEMHWLAQHYANRPDIVQGAGGNISVKVNDTVMLIKASGREFSEIGDLGRGLVPVFYNQLREYVLEKPPTADESRHIRAVRASTDMSAGNDRPSMEVWFHTLLPAYVLHTHSAYVNILACSHEGSDLFRNILEGGGLSYAILPYHNPGFELGEALSNYLQTSTQIPSIIFLENHGIIVSGTSAQECVTLHTVIEESIKNELTIDAHSFDMSDLNEKEVADFTTLVLFPDQVVYPEHKAIRAAHRFILQHIEKAGLTARGIESENITIVQNMDAEKHRKSLKSSK